MQILSNANYEDILFFDIETVRVVDKLEEGSDLEKSWEYKMKYIKTDENYIETGNHHQAFHDKAALYAEFAKIVCISVGRLNGETKEKWFKSFADKDEKTLLTQFGLFIEKTYSKNKRLKLCGQSIIGFDIPFVMRRSIINGLPVPVLFDCAHLKPWEVTAIDTNVIWKATGFYSASLANIAVAMGFPFPKEEMSGSETGKVYWEEKDLEKITRYCESDVNTVINIVQVMKGETVEPEPEPMPKLTQDSKYWDDAVARVKAGFDSDLEGLKKEFLIEEPELSLLTIMAENLSK